MQEAILVNIVMNTTREQFLSRKPWEPNKTIEI